MSMDPLTTSLENQLLTTKFYVPVSLGPLLSRPRLTSLLDESLKYSLTLVSAAAGFGKTTLLSTWSQSLPANSPRVAWVSLDEEDNEPRLFWTYILAAFNKQLPERFRSLLALLQSPQSPPLSTLLAELINLLVEQRDHFLLILDDYQVITEPQVHTTLAYLIEHLPAQLRIIVATRADPPLPFARLRAQRLVLEVRTDQLRCTAEETRAFLDEVMGLSLPDEMIQEVTTRTEGWLVGLQLLGLSLPDRVNPGNLLKEISGDQRYILDYLTEEVLSRLSEEVRTFLLCTSILGRLTASLCDAVMEQHDSQQMLQRLERANLFVVSLDSRRLWYRYHALFTEALCHQLEQTQGDLVLILHHRASRWYAEHDQITEAILHALRAQEWQWAADLIERKCLALMAYMWGASHHSLALLQAWQGQLPAEVMHARPLLCYASSILLFQIAPFSLLHSWLDAAEATLTASLAVQTHPDAFPTMLPPHMQQEQQNLLGSIMGFRAALRSFEGDGWTALALCEQALTLISADNVLARSLNLETQALAFSFSDVNDAKASVQVGLQAVSLALDTGLYPLAFNTVGSVAMFMTGAGQLHETQRLAQQAIFLGKQPGKPVLPEVGLPIAFQAEILREWNQLDTALSLAEEAILLYKQVESIASLVYLLCCYSVLLHVYLSHAELDAAQSVLQQAQHIGTSLSQPIYLHTCAHFITVDQIRLWLACGELDRATDWAKNLDVIERHSNPYVREREEVACVRVLLAKQQPDLALKRLEPVLHRATTGKRWGHVIEIQLLQALAHRTCDEETQALDALSEAVRLAEPEGYIRSFLDEGAPMEALLYRLRKRNRKSGPTPYLDMLLTAFQQENKAYVRADKPTEAYQLPEPLSERELEVLQLLVRGTSNQEIAQQLVITLDTVKRHVSHIFSKLGVHNRVQAARQARELGLLDEED
jgi:LuxR family maltose regulon positive regulatory protein